MKLNESILDDAFQPASDGLPPLRLVSELTQIKIDLIGGGTGLENVSLSGA